MEIILKENYPSLGYVGDRVAVRRGYARNFLIPRGIAVEASTRNAKLLKHQLGAINAKRARLKSEAEALAQQMGQHELSFKLKVGERGKTFGSVTNRDVVAALKHQGYDVDRKQVRLPEPIKQVGDSSVDVILHSEVSVPIRLSVIAEEVKKKPELDEGRGKRGRRGEAARADKREALEQEGDQELEGSQEAEQSSTAEEGEQIASSEAETEVEESAS